MSVWLYRLGGFAYRRPWRVIGGWLAVVAAVAGLLVAYPPQLTNEMRIAGTPAQRVVDDLATRMPEASGGQGVLAFQAPKGERVDTPQRTAALLSAVDAVAKHDHVIDARDVLAREAAKADRSLLLGASAAISSSQGEQRGGPVPFVVQGEPVPGVLLSEDGSVALLQFQFDDQTHSLPSGTIEDVVQSAEHAVAGTGIEVLPGAAMAEMPELIGVGELVGIGVAALVLLVTLGSVVAAGLPLLLALTGVAVGVGGAFTLTHVIDMQSVTVVLALMLGLAVGIDYGLFVVHRARRFLAEDGLDTREAAARATGTAGSAVFFAGLTVIIALLGLAVARIPLLTTMGLVAAATVAVVVLTVLTLAPALLGLAGDRIRPRRRAAHQDGGRLAGRVADLLVRHRVVAALVAVLLPLLLALPALGMRLTLPSGASYDPSMAQRQSYETVSAAFGPGYNGPLLVAVHADDALSPGRIAAIHQRLIGVDGVASASLAGVNASGDTAILAVVTERGPDTEATKDLVLDLRERGTELAGGDGVTLGVAGVTAMSIDVSDRLAGAMPAYLATVLLLSLVILTLVFRSLLVPLQATLGFVLSVAATLGATTAVFQRGWAQGLLGLDAVTPVVSMLPIIVTGVLYGLAMDYQVFLVTSMREAHVRGADAKDAVRTGFRAASRVVAAAAVIMVSVFAGFILNPEPMVTQIGFALAFGILVDAVLIRMVFVPATMALLGDRAWRLPGWLDRVLPDLDVEGAHLEAYLAKEEREPVAVP